MKRFIKRITKKFKTFIRIPLSLKWLFIKALFISAVARFTLSFLPFRRVMKWLGKTNVETPYLPDPTTIAYRKQVARAINLCNRYSFWKTECYTQALTGKIMLRQKNISSTLYIGFTKASGKYEGHAWLRSADMYITGKGGMEQFQVHSFFS